MIEINEVHVQCPYCNTQIKIDTNLIKVFKYGMNILLCPVEEGGCDRYFAFKLNIAINAKSYKIEGQEDELVQ